MIGDRQRHHNLTGVLFAELAAILPRHTDRMPALLGKADVVDDPGFDRPVALDRRRNQFPHLRQYPLVRSRRDADKVQQRLGVHHTRAGAVTASSGSTLLRSPGSNSPRQ